MKDTEERASFLLLIIKNALENTMYGNERTVDSSFQTAWFTKTFMKTVNFMSYFLDPPKEDMGKSIALQPGPEFCQPLIIIWLVAMISE